MDEEARNQPNPASGDIDAAIASIRSLASGHPQSDLIQEAAELLLKTRASHIRSNSRERDNALIWVWQTHFEPDRYTPNASADAINKIMMFDLMTSLKEEPARTIFRALELNGGKPLAAETIRKKISGLICHDNL
ncbi:hypothetical protein C8J37_1122 [Rhizobium sp. PP-WC-1G-195]|nr:hypothetical protein C8J37_1122 [Rhizobium sp. PP-WC-1G-195]